MFSIYGSIWKVIENQPSNKCADCPKQERLQCLRKGTETATNRYCRTGGTTDVRVVTEMPWTRAHLS